MRLGAVLTRIVVCITCWVSVMVPSSSMPTAPFPPSDAYIEIPRLLHSFSRLRTVVPLRLRAPVSLSPDSPSSSSMLLICHRVPDQESSQSFQHLLRLWLAPLNTVHCCTDVFPPCAHSSGSILYPRPSFSNVSDFFTSQYNQSSLHPERIKFPYLSSRHSNYH